MTTAEFWIQRWQRGETGWHQPLGNAMLQRHWARLGLRAGARVLVPLCGAAPDLLWLRSHGCRVIGVDLYAPALERVLREAGLPVPAPRRVGDHLLLQAPGMRLIAGDWFTLSPDLTGPVDACYDRAALVAVAPAQRAAYVARLEALCPPGTSGLLVTLEHLLPDGPPFAVDQATVRELFSPGWEVRLLERRRVDNMPPAALAAGPCFEAAWQLRRL